MYIYDPQRITLAKDESRRVEIGRREARQPTCVHFESPRFYDWEHPVLDNIRSAGYV